MVYPCLFYSSLYGYNQEILKRTFLKLLKCLSKCPCTEYLSVRFWYMCILLYICICYPYIWIFVQIFLFSIVLGWVLGRCVCLRVRNTRKIFLIYSILGYVVLWVNWIVYVRHFLLWAFVFIYIFLSLYICMCHIVGSRIRIYRRPFQYVRIYVSKQICVLLRLYVMTTVGSMYIGDTYMEERYIRVQACFYGLVWMWMRMCMGVQMWEGVIYSQDCFYMQIYDCLTIWLVD